MSTITVCTTCRLPHIREAWKSAQALAEAEGRPAPETPHANGEDLLAAVEAAAAAVEGVEVRGVACIMGCAHGCNAAVSAEGKTTYVLGGFEPNAGAAEALVAFAAGHAASSSGMVPFKQWPEGVKGHFKARVPALDRAPDLG